MWPLIDDELQKTDRLQSNLDELSAQITDALATYDRVMKEQAAEMVAGAGEQHPIPQGVMRKTYNTKSRKQITYQ